MSTAGLEEQAVESTWETTQLKVRLQEKDMQEEQWNHQRKVMGQQLTRLETLNGVQEQRITCLETENGEQRQQRNRSKTNGLKNM